MALLQKNDLQLKASYTSSPPCTADLRDTIFFIFALRNKMEPSHLELSRFFLLALRSEWRCLRWLSLMCGVWCVACGVWCVVYVSIHPYL